MVVLPGEISGIVKNPIKSFEENPKGILDIITFACEAEFILDNHVMDAAITRVKLLDNVSLDYIRDNFEKVISSKKAGKGILLLAQIGVIDYLLGENAIQNMSKNERDDFSIYVENIDKTMQTRLRRVALFYKCFAPKKAEAAIKRLHFTKEDEEHLLDSIYLLDKLYFLTNKYDLKKFLVKYGMERYEFLNNVSKAQRIVFDLPVNRIISRQYILDNIRQYNEPVFIEDLAISADDLRDLGINQADINRILGQLLDLSHIKPNLNTKKDMLEYAEKYRKNKWAAAFKKLKYIK